MGFVSAAAWLWNHDPFGNGAPSGAFSYDLRFPGQFFDQGAKLHYNCLRDYDRRLGRYIESDSVGLAGGINTYAYAEGNLLVNSDPSGLDNRYGLPNRFWPWYHRFGNYILDNGQNFGMAA